MTRVASGSRLQQKRFPLKKLSPAPRRLGNFRSLCERFHSFQNHEFSRSTRRFEIIAAAERNRSAIFWRTPYFQPCRSRRLSPSCSAQSRTCEEKAAISCMGSTPPRQPRRSQAGSRGNEGPEFGNSRMNSVSDQHAGTHDALTKRQKYQPISSIVPNGGLTVVVAKNHFCRRAQRLLRIDGHVSDFKLAESIEWNPAMRVSFGLQILQAE
jgi:hypothetical protein